MPVSSRSQTSLSLRTLRDGRRLKSIASVVCCADPSSPIVASTFLLNPKFMVTQLSTAQLCKMLSRFLHS